MKTRYTIASILIVIGLIIHCIGGELTDIKSLMQSNIPDNMKIEIRAVWYLLSIDFLVSGGFIIVFLLIRRIKENNVLINFIGIRMFLYGILFLMLIIFTNTDLLFQVPQWILLISIGLLLEWDFIIRIIRR